MWLMQNVRLFTAENRENLKLGIELCGLIAVLAAVAALWFQYISFMEQREEWRDERELRRRELIAMSWETLRRRPDTLLGVDHGYSDALVTLAELSTLRGVYLNGIGLSNFVVRGEPRLKELLEIPCLPGYYDPVDRRDLTRAYREPSDAIDNYYEIFEPLEWRVSKDPGLREASGHLQGLHLADHRIESSSLPFEDLHDGIWINFGVLSSNLLGVTFPKFMSGGYLRANCAQFSSASNSIFLMQDWRENDFRAADFTGSFWMGVDVEEGGFVNADFSGATLIAVNFEGGVNLKGAKFDGTKFFSVEISKSILKEESIAKALRKGCLLESGAILFEQLFEGQTTWQEYLRDVSGEGELVSWGSEREPFVLVDGMLDEGAAFEDVSILGLDACEYTQGSAVVVVPDLEGLRISMQRHYRSMSVRHDIVGR